MTFAEEQAALWDEHAAYYGATIEYHRGADSNKSITAQWIETEEELFDAEGFRTVVKNVSFAIKRTDLTINDTAITPRIGDRIKLTIAGSVHVFTVMNRGDQECYDWSDAAKTGYHVHTRLNKIE